MQTRCAVRTVLWYMSLIPPTSHQVTFHKYFSHDQAHEYRANSISTVVQTVLHINAPNNPQHSTISTNPQSTIATNLHQFASIHNLQSPPTHNLHLSSPHGIYLLRTADVEVGRFARSSYFGGAGGGAQVCTARRHSRTSFWLQRLHTAAAQRALERRYVAAAHGLRGRDGRARLVSGAG